VIQAADLAMKVDLAHDLHKFIERRPDAQSGAKRFGTVLRNCGSPESASSFCRNRRTSRLSSARLPPTVLSG
jgi:hypothetical protein